MPLHPRLHKLTMSQLVPERRTDAVPYRMQIGHGRDIAEELCGLFDSLLGLLYPTSQFRVTIKTLSAS
jgi:hypothetical protein